LYSTFFTLRYNIKISELIKQIKKRTYNSLNQEILIFEAVCKIIIYLFYLKLVSLMYVEKITFKGSNIIVYIFSVYILCINKSCLTKIYIYNIL